MQWDGGEDQDDADQAGAEAGGGSERQPGAEQRQGGETQGGAGEHEAETQVWFITNCILKFSFLIKFFIQKWKSTINNYKLPNKKPKAFESSFFETMTFNNFLSVVHI